MPFGKSRRQAASSLTRKKILSVFASPLRKAGFTAEDQCGEAASQSDYLAQRRKGRKVRRLRVKIICKSFHLSPSKLGDFAPWREEFPTPSAFSRPTSDRHDPGARTRSYYLFASSFRSNSAITGAWSLVPTSR